MSQKNSSFLRQLVRWIGMGLAVIGGFMTALISYLLIWEGEPKAKAEASPVAVTPAAPAQASAPGSGNGEGEVAHTGSSVGADSAVQGQPASAAATAAPGTGAVAGIATTAGADGAAHGQPASPAATPAAGAASTAQGKTESPAAGATSIAPGKTALPAATATGQKPGAPAAQGARRAETPERAAGISPPTDVASIAAGSAPHRVAASASAAPNGMTARTTSARDGGELAAGPAANRVAASGPLAAAVPATKQPEAAVDPLAPPSQQLQQQRKAFADWLAAHREGVIADLKRLHEKGDHAELLRRAGHFSALNDPEISRYAMLAAHELASAERAKQAAIDEAEMKRKEAEEAKAQTQREAAEKKERDDRRRLAQQIGKQRLLAWRKASPLSALDESVNHDQRTVSYSATEEEDADTEPPIALDAKVYPHPEWQSEEDPWLSLGINYPFIEEFPFTQVKLVADGQVLSLNELSVHDSSFARWASVEDVDYAGIQSLRRFAAAKKAVLRFSDGKQHRDVAVDAATQKKLRQVIDAWAFLFHAETNDDLWRDISVSSYTERYSHYPVHHDHDSAGSKSETVVVRESSSWVNAAALFALASSLRGSPSQAQGAGIHSGKSDRGLPGRFSSSLPSRVSPSPNRSGASAPPSPAPRSSALKKAFTSSDSDKTSGRSSLPSRFRASRGEHAGSGESDRADRASGFDRSSASRSSGSFSSRASTSRSSSSTSSWRSSTSSSGSRSAFSRSGSSFGRKR